MHVYVTLSMLYQVSFAVWFGGVGLMEPPVGKNPAQPTMPISYCDHDRLRLENRPDVHTIVTETHDMRPIIH